MKLRLLFIAVALIALTSFAFGDASVQFLYTPGANAPLTDDGCFAASPIPDGTPVNVYKGATLLGSPTMNGGAMGMGSGYFMLNYVAGVPGSDWSLEVVSGGCTYTSIAYTTIDGPQQVFVQQADWSCNCGNPGCEVIEEYSEQSP